MESVTPASGKARGTQWRYSKIYYTCVCNAMISLIFGFTVSSMLELQCNLTTTPHQSASETEARLDSKSIDLSNNEAVDRSLNILHALK